MYISEISPVSIKGAIGVSHQFMITFGILLGFSLSVKQVGLSFHHERLTMYSNTHSCSFQGFLLPIFYRVVVFRNWFHSIQQRI